MLTRNSEHLEATLPDPARAPLRDAIAALNEEERQHQAIIAGQDRAAEQGRNAESTLSKAESAFAEHKRVQPLSWRPDALSTAICAQRRNPGGISARPG